MNNPVSRIGPSVAVTCALLGVVPTTGIAQSSSPFEITGWAALSYFEDPSNSESFYYTDLDIVVAPGAFLSSAALGFALGVEALGSSSGREHALYPTIFYDTSVGRFSAGIPRSVYDRGYLANELVSGSIRSDFELALLFSDSFVTVGYLKFGVDNPLGLRWDHEFGNTKVGASYHVFNEPTDNRHVLGLAFRHEFEAISSFYQLAVFGGIERFWDSMDSRIQASLGVEAETERGSVGVQLSHSAFPSELENLRVFGSYNVTDSLSLRGEVGLVAFTDSNDGFVSGQVRYDFNELFFVDATYVDFKNFPGQPDELWEVSIGVNF